MAVGANGEDSSAKGVNSGIDEDNNSEGDSGAVYVFTRTGSAWSFQAYIKASNTDGGDRLGQSLFLFGDILAVGAPSEASNAVCVGSAEDNSAEDNNDALRSGAVYVFTRTGSTWRQEAYVKASNTEGGDIFGQDVSISGDSLVVSARLESSNAIGIDGAEDDNSALKSGAIYIFE